MKQLPMSIKQQEELTESIRQYLHKEVFARPSTIATYLGQPLSRVSYILQGTDFYCDKNGCYALKGAVRQAMNKSEVA